MLYSDINADTPYKNPQVLDLDSVIQSIRSIMRTKMTEVLFLPEFGFEGEDYLFEDIDDVNSLILFQNIVNSISFWDDRVILDVNNSTVILDTDNNKYTAYLSFKIKGFTDVFSIAEPIGG